jgi:hypothetical protein
VVHYSSFHTIVMSAPSPMNDLRYTLLRNAIQLRNVSNWIASFVSCADILIASVLRRDEISAWMNHVRLTNIQQNSPVSNSVAKMLRSPGS